MYGQALKNDYAFKEEDIKAREPVSATAEVLFVVHGSPVELLAKEVICCNMATD